MFYSKQSFYFTQPVYTWDAWKQSFSATRILVKRTNTLPTASDSTTCARPTGISGVDSPWRRLCFGLDSPIPFFSFIANGYVFQIGIKL